jgi:hypothetical protein
MRTAYFRDSRRSRWNVDGLACLLNHQFHGEIEIHSIAAPGIYKFARWDGTCVTSRLIAVWAAMVHGISVRPDKSERPVVEHPHVKPAFMHRAMMTPAQ